MKEIFLTQGKSTIVDDQDYDYLMQWKWFYSTKGYAVRGNYQGKIDGKYKQTLILMHRTIMNPADKMSIDHINSNGLDNRRENLRICTHSENLRNQSIQNRPNKKSVYKGVSFHKRDLYWFAYIVKDRKMHHLGKFPSEISAAEKYNSVVHEYFGEFAKPNIIDYDNNHQESMI